MVVRVMWNCRCENACTDQRLLNDIDNIKWMEFCHHRFCHHMVYLMIGFPTSSSSNGRSLCIEARIKSSLRQIVRHHRLQHQRMALRELSAQHPLTSSKTTGNSHREHRDRQRQNLTQQNRHREGHQEQHRQERVAH